MTDSDLGHEAGPVEGFTHDVGGAGGKEVSMDDQAKPDEVREAADDAALEGLLGALDVVGADGAQSTLVDEEVPGAEGPPPDVTAEEAAPEAPQSEPETPAVLDDERRLAEAIIRRDGEWTAEDLAALPRERILAIAKQREKVQTDMDGHMSELVEFRKKSELPPGERTGRENEAEALTSQRTDLTKLAEALALDEDGAQVLADSFSKQVAPLLQEITSLKDGNRNAEGIARRVEAELVRRDLSDRFHQIKDPNGPGYKQVLATMDTLTKAGEHIPTAQLMEDAALITFAKEIRDAAAQDDTKLRNARANGQVVTTTNDRVSKDSATDPKKMTQDERESAALDMLDQGGSAADHAKRVSDARKIGGSLW